MTMRFASISPRLQVVERAREHALGTTSTGWRLARAGHVDGEHARRRFR